MPYEQLLLETPNPVPSQAKALTAYRPRHCTYIQLPTQPGSEATPTSGIILPVSGGHSRLQPTYPTDGSGLPLSARRV